METRELIAYALIALLVVAVSLGSRHLYNKRKRRRREMRGFHR